MNLGMILMGSVLCTKLCDFYDHFFILQIYLHEYNMNREWELISVNSSRDPGVYSCCPDDTFPTVTFKFVLQRHSGSYTAIVVAPAVGEYNRGPQFFKKSRSHFRLYTPQG